jgi:hypothetical protein
MRSTCHLLMTGVIGQASTPSRMGVVTRAVADKKMFYPGAISPKYLNGSLAGDYGWDPLGFGADPVALKWYRQVCFVSL